MPDYSTESVGKVRPVLARGVLAGSLAWFGYRSPTVEGPGVLTALDLADGSVVSRSTLPDGLPVGGVGVGAVAAGTVYVQPGTPVISAGGVLAAYALS